MRRAAPAPRMLELITWVVEIGALKTYDVMYMMVAAVDSAAKTRLTARSHSPALTRDLLLLTPEPMYHPLGKRFALGDRGCRIHRPQ